MDEQALMDNLLMQSQEWYVISCFRAWLDVMTYFHHRFPLDLFTGNGGLL